MITGTIKELVKYKGTAPYLDEAIDWLQKADLAALPLGKTVIDGDHVFINVMEADLRPEESARFEVHKRYADVQVNISGSEAWGYTTVCTHADDYNAGADVFMADGPVDVHGILGNDRVVIFCPGELHMPSLINKTCTHVRKAVIKVEM